MEPNAPQEKGAEPKDNKNSVYQGDGAIEFHYNDEEQLEETFNKLTIANRLSRNNDEPDNKHVIVIKIKNYQDDAGKNKDVKHATVVIMDNNEVELEQNINLIKNNNAVIENEKQEDKLERAHSGKLTVNSANELKQHKKSFSEKLANTRKRLQLKQNELNIKNSMPSFCIAQKSLQSMECSKCSAAKDPPLPNDGQYLQSRESLLAVIDGFQQLVWKMISSDRTMLNPFLNAARKIDVLKDLPFVKDLKKERKGRTRKQRKDSICTDEEIYQPGPKNCIRKKEQENAKVKQNKKQASIEFAKYINDMLHEILGDDQKEKLEKYKCLPQYLDDLEPFANALAEEGYGNIVEEEIRINRKNNRLAFISMSNDRESNVRDAIVEIPVARRYAFDGDIVRAFILNDDRLVNKKNRKSSSSSESDIFVDAVEDFCSEKSDSDNDMDNENCLASVNDNRNCRKAFVIKIIKQTEHREVVGSISFTQATEVNFELFYKLRPHDLKLPMIFISKETCQNEINNIDKQDICGMLYVAKIVDVDVDGHCIGELVQPVGKVGNLDAEMKAILLCNGLKDMQPFEQKYQDMFVGPITQISDEDLKYREDLRKKCVFTIDPLTAKDLDDAMSIDKLNDNEYEIGVHISDVSYYLEENSDLDNLVKHRATSVYLVNEVIHMLPTSLCFKCSLLPGEDKFAFSVFWRWDTEKQELSSPRFTRSVINSCSQFAYEHAQKILDNPQLELDNNDLPDILNQWTPHDIKWRVLLLNEIAQKLKAKRYENGAISINNTKIRFQLHPKTGEPIEFEKESRQEANFLIEEFMLLSNQSVAKFIHDSFPNNAILRNHGPPLTRSLKSLKERLISIGFDIDITSSKTIYESMQDLIKNASDPQAAEACISTLLTKPMARAKYFCSEGRNSEADFSHYALSIPIYTHFTSPIRRYPDIMVHRLLAAALNYCPPPQRTTDELHQLAKICNDQKLNARNAGDESSTLFFKRYLKAKESITLNAVVTELGERVTNVVIIETGHSITILHKMQKCLVITKNVPKALYITTENPGPAVKLQLFSTLQVRLALRNEQICGFFVMNDKMPLKKEKSTNRPDNDEVDDNTPTTSSNSRRRNNSRLNKNVSDFLKFYAIKN